MPKVSIPSLAILAAFVLMAGAGPAAAAISDFVGSWSNADPAARGISRVDVRANGGQMLVHVWGKCHPTDCDWGEQSAHLFSPNVGVPIDAGANAATAEFDKNGSNTMLILTSSSGGGLSFRSYTIFTDGSARSDYDNSGHFNRQQ